MDLGVAGRTAIVCASSRGLGRACADALGAEGVDLVICARTPGPLDEAADAMRRAHGVKVTPVAADAATEEGRKAILAACTAPDILINNAAGPPPGDWRAFDRAAWAGALDANLLSAVFMIKAVADGMAERGFGRIVNITSAMVKAPIEALSLSVSARLGLTGFVRAIAGGLARRNVTINNLLPEQFETDRLRKNLAFLADKEGLSLEQEIEKQLKANPSGRFGRPEEFGAACAFLCSAHAGYLTGQNILIDGGRLPSVF